MHAADLCHRCTPPKCAIDRPYSVNLLPQLAKCGSKIFEQRIEPYAFGWNEVFVARLKCHATSDRSVAQFVCAEPDDTNLNLPMTVDESLKQLGK